jgi:hypothetical protein
MYSHRCQQLVVGTVDVCWGCVISDCIDVLAFISFMCLVATAKAFAEKMSRLPFVVKDIL